MVERRGIYLWGSVTGVTGGRGGRVGLQVFVEAGRRILD